MGWNDALRMQAQRAWREKSVPSPISPRQRAQRERQEQRRREWDIEAIEALLLTKTSEGRGNYTDTISYKLAKGDLTREEVSRAFGAPLAVVPIAWGLDSHERLMSQQPEHQQGQQQQTSESMTNDPTKQPEQYTAARTAVEAYMRFPDLDREQTPEEKAEFRRLFRQAERACTITGVRMEDVIADIQRPQNQQQQQQSPGIDRDVAQQPTDPKEAQRQAIREEIWRVYRTETLEKLAAKVVAARDEVDINRLMKSHHSPPDVAELYRLLNIPSAQLERDLSNGWPGVASGIARHLGKPPVDPVADQERKNLRTVALAVKRYEDHLRERVEWTLKGATPEERKHFERRIESLVADYRNGLVSQQSYNQAMPAPPALARARQQQKEIGIHR